MRARTKQQKYEEANKLTCFLSLFHAHKITVRECKRNKNITKENVKLFLSRSHTASQLFNSKVFHRVSNFYRRLSRIIMTMMAFIYTSNCISRNFLKYFPVKINKSCFLAFFHFILLFCFIFLNKQYDPKRKSLFQNRKIQ